MAGRALLRRFLYRRGWDTRCRNLPAARALRRALANLPAANGPALLDVGCGSAGVATYLGDLEVVGVDLEPPEESLPNLAFRQGTITSLPFPDQSFPLVSCVDVLEHLPLEARDEAIGELVRVARHGVLIACPHGETRPELRHAVQASLGCPRPSGSRVDIRAPGAALSHGLRGD